VNLLHILATAARRLGVPSMKMDAPRSLSMNVDDPDLVHRLEHGLGRRLNRREVFRFAAIAGAVGVPALREVILAPAKTIVLPPVPTLEPVTLAEPAFGTSNAEAIAAQFEIVREKLPQIFDARWTAPCLITSRFPVIVDPCVPRNEIWFLASNAIWSLAPRPGENDVRLVNISVPVPDWQVPDWQEETT
jgi:hypothetical protein